MALKCSRNAVRIQTLFNGQRTTQFVAMCNTQKVGHLDISWEPEGGRVTTVSVHSGALRQGIATALYEAAAKLAAGRGLPLLSDFSRYPGAKGFWQKQATKGRAVPVHTGPNKYGIDPENVRYYKLNYPPPESLAGAPMKKCPRGCVPAGSLGTIDRNSLSTGEARRLVAALRAEGVKPPKVGHCVKAFGGEVCRHPKSKYLKGDSGYQAISLRDGSFEQAPVGRKHSRWAGLGNTKQSHPDYHQPEHILEGMARVLWTDAWASELEERGERAGGPGVELTDVAPPTPPEAMALAQQLVEKVQQTNADHIGNLVLTAWDADEAAGTAQGDWQEYQRSFGSDLAMQALGHGVGWFDDHAKFKLRVPHIENYSLRELVR